MIEPKDFFTKLQGLGVNLFAGVPDSLLKSFCAYVDDNAKAEEHIITANEGNAIALATGYHLTTGKMAAVYLQNSGIGNTINPLTSITDRDVYSIPLLMIVGWRGEPEVKGEPQHVKQGAITPQQLELLNIPYRLIEADTDIEEVLSQIIATANETSAPVALLVRKGAFAKYQSQRKPNAYSSLKREDALRTLLGLTGDSLIVSTTGKTSREVFERRIERGEQQRDFLTVGGMGHTASIAFGVALGSPGKQVVCLDCDASALMHLGALPVIGNVAPGNLIHVLLNNAAHESAGGQPTVAGDMDFEAIASACGYSHYYTASDAASIKKAWQDLTPHRGAGPIMLEVKITTGSRDDLGRPTSTPVENKKAFMQEAMR